LRPGSLIALALIAAGLAPAPHAQTPPDQRDPVQALQDALQSGKVKLQQGPGPWGYLPSLLKALNIPVDSQVLVFSKTSLQVDQIGPKTPRAIYFNDDVAVGGVQGGRLSEILTTGPNGLAIFYSLPTSPSEPPIPEHEGDLCYQCHATVNTWAAGGIVANVIPQDDGAPLFITADRLFDITDSTTPFDQRWGGWYVTGRHGALRHNGNVRLAPDALGDLDPKAGQNITDLSPLFDVKPYLAPTSDIVALMTLEHQIGAMNRIWTLQAKANALHGQGAQTSTPADVDASIEDLVAYLVGAHEAPLPSPVTGVSTFTQTFPKRGPWDAKGRSLRDFDLKTRLFRYPLSYTIYGRAFNSLAPPLRARVYQRLFEVLTGADHSPAFARLTAEDRRAALDILIATKPDLPAYWRTGAG
jgi:hypothetical protein